MCWMWARVCVGSEWCYTICCSAVWLALQLNQTKRASSLKSSEKRTKKDSVKCYTEAAAAVTVVFCVFLFLSTHELDIDSPQWATDISILYHIISHHIISCRVVTCHTYYPNYQNTMYVCVCTYIHTTTKDKTRWEKSRMYTKLRRRRLVPLFLKYVCTNVCIRAVNIESRNLGKSLMSVLWDYSSTPSRASKNSEHLHGFQNFILASQMKLIYLFH